MYNVKSKDHLLFPVRSTRLVLVLALILTKHIPTLSSFLLALQHYLLSLFYFSVFHSTPTHLASLQCLFISSYFC